MTHSLLGMQDLSMELNTDTGAPSEPLREVSRKAFNLKTAFPVAIHSSRKVEEH